MNWYCEVFKLLLVRKWEGEVFLFNPLTTHTHILNELGWHILCACAEAPLSQQRLLDQLREGMLEGDEGPEGPETVAEGIKGLNSEELRNVLNGHLNQLSELGLLEGSETLAA